jgi:hypothetical protein
MMVGFKSLGQEGLVIRARLVGGRLEVTRRYPSGQSYACDPPRPVPDVVEREIYEARGGQIVLARTIRGTHVPAHRVGEQIVFEGDDVTGPSSGPCGIVD